LTDGLTHIPVTPEFSRSVQVEGLGANGATIALKADAGECTAVANRLDLQEVKNLQAEATLRRTAVGLVRLNVEFSANVIQSCVVTLDPVPGRVADRFTLLCEGEQKQGRDDDGGDVYVDPFGEDPVEVLTDGCLDIGELLIQHLSLALNPYPHADGVEEGVVMEDARGEGAFDIVSTAGSGLKPAHEAEPERENPFAVLAQMRAGGRKD
jgi:uncharacterized metal-binding protein YceD (DUF177 family)